MDAPTQVKYARELVFELDSTDDYGVGVPDLLDCLACAGLRLERDDDGISSAAYFSLFKPKGVK